MLFQDPDFNPEDIDWKSLPRGLKKKMKRIFIDLLNDFNPCFTRKEQKMYFKCYMKGLLSTDIKRKNEQQIALAFMGSKKVRGMEGFMSKSPWDYKLFLDILQKKMAEELNSQNGMITIDESDFRKKGNNSPGVGRTYCGSLGKIDNCQVGMFIGYTAPGIGYGIMNQELYFSKQWFEPDHKELLAKCHAPKDLKYKTKNEIAIELLEDFVKKKLVKANWLGLDSAFGNDQKVLAKAEELGFKYFAGISQNTKIWPTPPEMIVPKFTGRGQPPKRLKLKAPNNKPVECSEYAKSPECEWHPVTLSVGSKGPIRADLFCKQVTYYRQRRENQTLWLFMLRLSNGEIKCFKSNAPADTPESDLIDASTKRWPIEQSFQTQKDCLGMDQYETRTWIAWVRHMILEALATLILVKLQKYIKKNSLGNVVNGTIDIRRLCSIYSEVWGEST